MRIGLTKPFVKGFGLAKKSKKGEKVWRVIESFLYLHSLKQTGSSLKDCKSINHLKKIERKIWKIS